MTDTAADIVEQDLEYITSELCEEFGRMGGKRLLIVGGAGFLGYYLVQAVLHWNRTAGRLNPIRLTVYDNYIRGIPEWLAALDGTAHLELIRHDITEPLPDDIGDVQYIVHAGSIASPIFYRRHPIETMDANIGGLRRLLDYALGQQSSSHPVEGFLFYSSSEIYGDPTPENIPTPETYRGNVSCTGPRSCYDESKRFGETLCVFFAQQHDLPITVVRPFNNYGPGLKITDKRVLPDFARDILSGRDIVMKSTGTPSRTFCYVADAVVGYYKVLVKGRPGEAYNIGVETPEITMAELAEKVVVLGHELWGYTGKVVRNIDEDYLADNPERRCPVIEKARKELGYAPKILVDEGLRRSLIWYAGNRDAEDA
ncbi:NAD-dependent epimerase/dehydratase family protein [Mycobacterium sp. 155]|uniref:NAD-dependent epimerase/dehydratase family protein n=1 Tax=Mycobacterium sp. 155 TaxID=1157943 RepID=UPI0003763D03|nr:NAD-dependent epimerase/dehydratase family protein [Mycobacterium sp. 155]